MIRLSRNTKVLNSYFPQNWQVYLCFIWSGNSVFGFTDNRLCQHDKHKRCPIIIVKRIMYCTRSHMPVTQCVQTRAHTLISSRNRLHMCVIFWLKMHLFFFFSFAVIPGWFESYSLLLFLVFFIEFLPFLICWSLYNWTPGRRQKGLMKKFFGWAWLKIVTGQSGLWTLKLTASPE